MGSSTNKTKRRYLTCLKVLEKRNQTHVLRWWEDLRVPQRQRLLADLESIPWFLLDPVLRELGSAAAPNLLNAELEPPEVLPHSPPPHDVALYEKARERGATLLRMGKVAAFTVAGGQGTRLGFDGPKGMVRVTPVGDRSLFALFAAMVKAARDRYRGLIPWYIMTSPGNHAETIDYFAKNDWFGLPQCDVRIFPQGMLPAFDFDGRLVLAARDRIAMAPDGHGGSLKAIATSGALSDMQQRGIEIISYFQVDNPLVKPFDPLFLGLHAERQSEMSTKVTAKSDDLEKVGNVCLRNGRLVIVEYSNFPEALAHSKNAAGGRKFDSGNLAIHLLDVVFVDRIAGGTAGDRSNSLAEGLPASDHATSESRSAGCDGGSFPLPLRQARKIVPFIDELGALVKPTEPNAIKLESFIFDALPLAKRTLVLEVERAEEFSPVKNRDGADSLGSARRDQVRRACRWLEAAGVFIPRDTNGEPNITLDIAPSFALDQDDVVAQADRLPVLRANTVIELA